MSDVFASKQIPFFSFIDFKQEFVNDLINCIKQIQNQNKDLIKVLDYIVLLASLIRYESDDHKLTNESIRDEIIEKRKLLSHFMEENADQIGKGARILGEMLYQHKHVEGEFIVMMKENIQQLQKILFPPLAEISSQLGLHASPQTNIVENTPQNDEKKSFNS